MVRCTLSVVFALLNTVAAAAAPKHDKNDRLPLSLVHEVQKSNASLVQDFLEPPNFAVPMDNLSLLRATV
jgi:hypothetical protein